MLAAAAVAEPASLVLALREGFSRAAAGLHAWPIAAGIVAAGIGIWLLLFGARLRRPMAVLGCLLLGALGGYAGAGLLARNLGLPLWAAMAAPAVILAAAGFFAPIFFPAAAGALAGALIAPFLSQVPFIAFLPVLGVAAGAIFERPFAAGGAAFLGSSLCCAAFFVLAGGAVPQAFAAHPFALIALVCVLTVAGAAFQWENAWPPPDRGYSPGRRSDVETMRM